MSVEPVPMRQRPPVTQPCPMCGGTMREHVSGCASCPMNRGCDLICCETCGYESVAPKSATVELARKIVRLVRGRARSNGTPDSDRN